MARRNVALTADNLGAWQDRLATVDTALDTALVGEQTLAPYVRERLRARRDDISRLLTPTNPERDKP